MTVSKTAAPNPVPPGGTLTYRLTVYNSGLFATAAHKLRDPIPAGTSNGACGRQLLRAHGRGEVHRALPAQGRGGRLHLHRAGGCPPGSTITNTAYADWDKQIAENNETNNTATVQGGVVSPP